MNSTLGSIGNFLSSNSSTLGSLLGSGLNAYTQQNAGEAVTNADLAGIGQAQNYLGNISSIYSPQQTVGNQAMTALGSAEGINGQPANYSGFENMPGYQFAVQQGTQAIQRQAAAMGSAYTPNTAQAVGQYVTGTAMQDYNNYISQLQQTSQLGASANQGLAQANLTTAGNIEQLGQNSGLAQAGIYTGVGQAVNGAGTANGSGTGTGTGSTSGSGVAGLIGSGLNMLGSLFGGGSANSSATLPSTSSIDSLGSLDLSGLGSTDTVSSSDFNNLNSGFTGFDGNTSGFDSSGLSF
jgi:hypothetical protein